MTGAARLYFEDVQLERVLLTPALTVTEAHVALFAGLTHDAPAEAGRVPDHLPLCLTTGLGWRVSQPPLMVLAFLAVEWQALSPVRVGDTIRSRSRTVAKRSLREDGVLVEEWEVINQRDEVVERGRFTFLVARRPGAGPAPAKETSS